MSETYNNWIDGAWVDGVSTQPNINPSNTNDMIGLYAQADAQQVDFAVHAALRAFPSWSMAGIQQRSDALDKIGNELISRREELGRLLSREEGKVLAEGMGEVMRAGYIFKFYAGECLRLTGETIASVRPGIGVEITREPLGVFGLITPWNFPMAIPAWKIAPALAYGNCVVFKPADLVPGCGWALAEIISRSGIPAGVFNLVMGPGRTIGEALVKHPGISGISFTGSMSVGQHIAELCAQLNKKVQLEMGGKNPQVILDDADLAQAVELCAQSAYYSTGQRCTASSRIIVTEGIHDPFVEALTKRVANIKVGNALIAGTDVGPVVSPSQLKQNLAYIDIARAEGGEILTGGQVAPCHSGSDEPGYFMRPALIANTTPDMRINREEVFGPVASIIRVPDYEHALKVANDTAFGLSAGIATTSLKYAAHFKRHAQVGMVMVNLPTAGVDYHVPFGGRKASNYGPREQGRYAIEFYTSVKTAYTQAG